jgi:hypothetical protein
MNKKKVLKLIDRIQSKVCFSTFLYRGWLNETHFSSINYKQVVIHYIHSHPSFDMKNGFVVSIRNPNSVV